MNCYSFLLKLEANPSVSFISQAVIGILNDMFFAFYPYVNNKTNVG
jgi:hypothetical protein